MIKGQESYINKFDFNDKSFLVGRKKSLEIVLELKKIWLKREVLYGEDKNKVDKLRKLKKI